MPVDPVQSVSRSTVRDVDSYSNLEFGGRLDEGRKAQASMALLSMANDVARDLNLKLTISSAYRPQDVNTRVSHSGGRGRHTHFNAIDIAAINGHSVQSTEGQRLADAFVSRYASEYNALVNKRETPDRNSVLWRTNTGGNHNNHIHLGLAHAGAHGEHNVARSISETPSRSSESVTDRASGVARTYTRGAINLASRTANRVHQALRGAIDTFSDDEQPAAVLSVSKEIPFAGKTGDPGSRKSLYVFANDPYNKAWRFAMSMAKYRIIERRTMKEVEQNRTGYGSMAGLIG